MTITVIINIFLIIILIICGSKKTKAVKKPPEPKKAKPIDVKPAPPPPSKPKEPAHKTPAPNMSLLKLKPARQKSIRELSHESSRSIMILNDCVEPDDYREQWAKENMKRTCADIVAEYVKNFSDPNTDKCPPCKAFDSHPELNRYKDIKCLDASRVIIKNGKSDYIHASRVEVPEWQRRYILSQSPMSNTVDDFWQMCLENEVKYIVMLCPFVEGGEEQSCQYFPKGEGEKQNYGNIEVELSEKKPHPVDEVSWNVLKVEDQKRSNSRTVINQISVPWWPDKSAPDDPTLTAHLVWWLKKRVIPKDSPIVVHCNNGTGRSATFVAISILRYYIQKTPCPTIVLAIKLLREMRFGAIECEEQYAFLYACTLQLFTHIMGLYDVILEDGAVIRPFLEDYKGYIQKKIEVRRPEMKKEKSLKVEPTKENNFSNEEVKKSQMSGAKKQSSKSKRKKDGKVA